VDRVAIDGVGIDFLVVIEDAVAPKGSRADDMSICEDVSAVKVLLATITRNTEPRW
jgi:hypothetical protein